MINTKHYVRWYTPGVIVSDIHDVELEGKGVIPPRPKHAYAYQTYERVEKMVDGELLKGGLKKFSPTTFYGEELTLGQVKTHPEATEILLWNMTNNGWSRVVRTIAGQWMPLEENDVVLPK